MDLHKINTKWLMHSWSTFGAKTNHECRNPTLAKCGGEAQHSQSWGLGVL
jgi:hypothetical protein